MPTAFPLPFSNLLEKIREALPASIPIYLVGGAVRDALLSRPTHDLDFVLPGQVLGIARDLANRLGAAFYPLDEERDTARLILILTDGSRQVLDLAAMRGPDLESDLRARDFTINAIALAISDPQVLLDPLGGAADLRAGLLRACSPTTFQDDPLRILRGIRLAVVFGFRILPDTRQQMRVVVPQLTRVSPERLRDELFRILESPKPATAIRALDNLDALSYVLPELQEMKGVEQSLPHINDVWTHSINALQKLKDVLNVLQLRHDPETAANMALGQVSLRLGRYREQIYSHIESSLNADRSHQALLSLATLYHDVGKPTTRRVDENGRIRFFEHDLIGEQMISRRANELRLSKDENERLRTIVRHHMRPFLLAQAGRPPTRRAVYRFFRDTGPAGVDICLLSLADILATYGPTLPHNTWANHLDVVRALLEAWWELPKETVSPPALINGRDLIEKFDLEPGPQIGQLLEMVREGQATGVVSNREDAFALVRDYVRRRSV